MFLKARQRQLSSHGIFLGPGARSSLIFGSVGLVHVGNFWHQGIIRVWIRQQRAYREQHLQASIENTEHKLITVLAP